MAAKERKDRKNCQRKEGGLTDLYTTIQRGFLTRMDPNRHNESNSSLFVLFFSALVAAISRRIRLWLDPNDIVSFAVSLEKEPAFFAAAKLVFRQICFCWFLALY